MNTKTKSYFIGSHLRRARDEKGWSQEVFASMVSMSQSNLSNIESNKQKVTWETIILMAEKLGVSPESLAGLEANLVMHIETQQGSANGNHNTVHYQSLGELTALQAHIASLQEENRFLRQQMEARGQ
ncbi:MAG: helix-turn-helix transcriptional regulator [Saprospiraceae bacterium]|nr:helix-turn-helix transcriptional regulator [Saprospiraceae bacterium]